MQCSCGTCTLSEIFNYFIQTMGSAEFTPSTRGCIIMLHELGYTYDQIKDVLNVTKNATWKTVKWDERYQRYHTQNSLPCTGHPKAVLTHTKHAILWEICTNHWAPFKDIAACVGNISERQVQQIVKQQGYHCCIACHTLTSQQVCETGSIEAGHKVTATPTTFSGLESDWTTLVCPQAMHCQHPGLG